MSIHTLIDDINAAVEWWTDYQEDDTAGDDNVPLDCLADAMALHEHDILKTIRESLEADDIDVSMLDKGDWQSILSDVLHFAIESKTVHMFADVRRQGYIEIDSWPLQEHHTQFEIDSDRHGRITEGRLKAIENSIEACISTYSFTPCDGVVQTVDLCWPTDAVWVFYADLALVAELVCDYIETNYNVGE